MKYERTDPQDDQIISDANSANIMCSCQVQINLVPPRDRPHYQLTGVIFYLNLNKNRKCKALRQHVGKVSSIFEFFLRRFALVSLLGLRKVELSAECCALANGAVFDLEHQAKMLKIQEKLIFFSKNSNSIFTAIRCLDFADI